MILALAGGVGGARMAAGLARVLVPAHLAIVVNTGDDFEHLGLSISPDLDSVTYTLAGRHDSAQGWGLAGDSRRCLQALAELGGDTWFQLGDLDLATHLQRSARLRAGASLSQVTAELCAALGVRHTVAPMSDQPVRTKVETDAGELDFQDYFVRRHCTPQFKGLRFEGALAAKPSPVLATALQNPRLAGIVICPSNPWLSIRPILALPGVERALRERHVRAAAVSPIVGGSAVKGPLAKMMRELGLAATAVEIARLYAGLIDAFIIDESDAALAPAIERLGLTVRVMPTLLSSPERQDALALAAIELVRC